MIDELQPGDIVVITDLIDKIKLIGAILNP
jgi:hypothetical protein